MFGSTAWVTQHYYIGCFDCDNHQIERNSCRLLIRKSQKAKKVQLPLIIIVSYLIKKERELRDTVRFCIYQQLKSGLVCQNWVYYDFFFILLDVRIRRY